MPDHLRQMYSGISRWKSGYEWDAKVNGARQLAATSIPSSSTSSRIKAASGVSPGSTLPPGNSHSPPMGLPAGRWASNTRPSASTSATADTSTMGRPPPLPSPARGGGLGWGLLAAIAGIDIDIAVGQVAGPHRRLAAADAKIDTDRDLAALH